MSANRYHGSPGYHLTGAQDPGSAGNIDGRLAVDGRVAARVKNTAPGFAGITAAPITGGPPLRNAPHAREHYDVIPRQATPTVDSTWLGKR